jgi:hypothetical protein
VVVGIAAVSSIALMDKTENSGIKNGSILPGGLPKQIVPLLAIGVVIAGFPVGIHPRQHLHRRVIPTGG